MRYLRVLPRLLMPVEWLVLLFGIGTWSAYYHFGLKMPGQPGVGGGKGPGLFYLKQFLTSLDLYALIWLLIAVFAVLKECRRNEWHFKQVPWRAFWGNFSRRLYIEEVIQDIRFFHAVLVMFVIFALLKNLIPFIAPNELDEWFVRTEQSVCGGLLCGEWLIKWLGSGAAYYVSTHYMWYFPYMTLALFVMVAQRDRKLGHEYCFAFVLLFLIGILWIYLVPTWGPIYARPDAYKAIDYTDVAGLQKDLWQMKLYLHEHPEALDAVYMISGFPSLHVAVAVLGSIYVSRISRILGVLSWLFVALITHATLYLGWHYLLDDIGSLVLVWISIKVAKAFSWEWRISRIFKKQPLGVVAGVIKA